MYSKTLNKEISIEGIEKIQGKRKIVFLNHAELKKLAIELNVQIAYIQQQYADGFGYQCVITDDKFRKTIGFGETNSKMGKGLLEEIPMTLSCHKAFDDAFIQYLQLDTEYSVYSNIQIMDETIEVTSKKPEKTVPKKTEKPAPKKTEKVAPKNELEDFEDFVDEPVVEETPVDEVSVDETPVDEVSEVQKALGELDDFLDFDDEVVEEMPVEEISTASGEVKFTIGAHKGKTVAEVFKENSGYIKWFAEKSEPKTPEMKALKSACQEILKLKA